MDIPIPISNFFCTPYIPIKDAVDGFQFQYTINQEPNPTENISLTLNSKRQLVVLMVCFLLSKMKAEKWLTSQKWN